MTCSGDSLRVTLLDDCIQAYNLMERYETPIFTKEKNLISINKNVTLDFLFGIHEIKISQTVSTHKMMASFNIYGTLSQENNIKYQALDSISSSISRTA